MWKCSPIVQKCYLTAVLCLHLWFSFPLSSVPWLKRRWVCPVPRPCEHQDIMAQKDWQRSLHPRRPALALLPSSRRCLWLQQQQAQTLRFSSPAPQLAELQTGIYWTVNCAGAQHYPAPDHLWVYAMTGGTVFLYSLLPHFGDTYFLFKVFWDWIVKKVW